MSIEQPAIRPTTGFSIRSRQYMRLISHIVPGSAIDIGGGQGYWAIKLAQLGWIVNIVEKSELARKDAVFLTKTASDKIRIYSTIEGLEKESMELLCALEVLEHIPNPLRAISDWADYLKPDGYALLSFPAWPEWLGAEDIKAGHLFRFNTKQVLELFSCQNNWSVCKMSGYGFPYRNLLQSYNNYRFRNRQFLKPEEETLLSGIYREARFPVWLDYCFTIVTDVCQRLIGPRKPNWGLAVLVQKKR